MTGPAAPAPPAGGPAPADRAAVRGWQLYDWAYSAFFTTVVAALGGPYVTALAEDATGPDGVLVDVLGAGIRPGSWFALVTSLSVVVQIPLLPLLGSYADAADRRRRLLLVTTLAGGAATAALPLAAGGAWLAAGLLFAVANVAAGVASMLYYALLPAVSTPEDSDRVSAGGFAVGYAGGGLLLAANLALVTFAEPLGLSTGDAARLSLASAGLWWVGFGVLSLQRMRATGVGDRAAAGNGVAGDEVAGDEEALATTWPALVAAARDLRALPGTLRFLVAYLLYNDAVAAVIGLSAVFLSQELYVAQGRDADDATGFLLALVLLIQAVAIGGSLAFARLAGRVGARPTILLTLGVWVGVVAYAGLVLSSTGEAVVLGAVIGLVLGATQSLSRSLFSRLVPPGREASFFGFYVLSERGTSWLAPALFAVVQSATGSYRLAIGSLAVLLVAGTVLLWRTDTDAAEEAAAAYGAAHPPASS